MDAQDIIEFIAKSPKRTPVKVYLKGDLDGIDFGPGVRAFLSGGAGVLFGEWQEIEPVLWENAGRIVDHVVESDRRHSAVPLLDTRNLDARIEPGAIIRDRVEIGARAIVMMGAVINIGAVVGEGTMIDMNAVLGGRAIVGRNCHIGAGAVLAGVIEPASAQPVTVGDDVMIGANAVILEGVRVGRGAVVAAGAVVTTDVEEDTVVAGVPARVIKKVDAATRDKTAIADALRQLGPGT
jgi:tetrahydrodipicolinate N-acetyltransferase